ncbi:hypothetical protein H8356DRAFT_1428385 [Neocallimastix lanati (nom. inval.)]|nr:hypothetical protein H8356DRAFT_1428385 [Neocallimastix sp. JGI-2020a]
MKRKYLFILLICLLPSVVFSITEQLNCKKNDFYSQYGVIVNEKKNAYISIEITKPEKTDYNITMMAIAFNILDLDNIGYIHRNEKYLLCSNALINDGTCEKEGEIIINKKELKNKVLSKLFTITDKTNYPYSTDLKYEIEETGFYSVILKPAYNFEYDKSYDLISNVEWHSSTGELPGSDYPKIKFYKILAIVYIIVFVLWSLKALKYRKDILQIQHYITGIIIIVTSEMIIRFFYYNHYNNTNKNSKFFLMLAEVLNAGGNSLTFLVLLIVCMGYNVVKQSLSGGTMKVVQLLALFHFIFGIIYSIGLMIVSKVSGLVVLFFVLPISITITIFYIWILAALNNSIKNLKTSHQDAKLNMFLNLRKILIICIIFILIFFITNSFNFMDSQDIQWIVNHWSTRWFWIDGFSNVLYLFGFLSIIFLWRPTANNKRYGIDQLPSNDVEEIDLEESFINKSSNGIIKKDDINVGFDFNNVSENKDEINQESDDDIQNWAEDNIEIKDENDSELYENLEIHVADEEEKLINLDNP